MRVAVVIVGDEILAGHVHDANSHFIAARVASHGHRLHRTTVVGDDPDAIRDEVARELDGPASLLAVCGGLGPTHDDRTMEGVAAAFGCGLVPCAPIAERIERIAASVDLLGVPGARFGIEGLRKMALAPEGAEALLTSRGVIPAVAVRDPRADVVVLPGPPRELQAVFLECVEPRWLEGTGDAVSREEIVHPFLESVVAEMLGEVQARFAATEIGSYPQADHSLIRITGPEADVRDAAAVINEALAALSGSDEGQLMLSFIEQRRRARDDA